MATVLKEVETNFQNSLRIVVRASLKAVVTSGKN